MNSEIPKHREFDYEKNGTRISDGGTPANEIRFRANANSALAAMDPSAIALG